MKRYFWFFVFSVILCLGIPVLAFADASYDRVYTVASNGSDVKKTDFDLGQKPWLFLELPDVTVYEWMATVYTYNHNGSSYTATPNTDPFFTDGDKIWLTLSDAKWFEIQGEGLWTVSLTSILVSGSSFDFVTGSTNFTVNNTVVPEPLSMSLFLLGSGVLALRRRRRKEILKA